MPTFWCRIATQGGGIAERTSVADSKVSLKNKLETEGNLVFEIRQVGGWRLFPFQLNSSRGFREKDFFAFNQEFSVLIRAGLSIVSALDSIIEKNDQSELNDILCNVRDDISKGESLSDSFGKYSHIISNLYVAMLQAGERSGNIPLAILRYVEYKKTISELKKKVISASVYPIILTVVAIFVLFFLLIYVVPAIAGTFFESGTELPLITAFLMTVSGHVRNNFSYLCIFLVLAAVGFSYFRKMDTGRLYLDSLKLKVPFFGELYINYATAKVARTLSTVLSGGIPLLDSVSISAGTLDNQFLELKFSDVVNDLKEGKSFAESLSLGNVFPGLAIRLIEAGEKGGDLEQVLNDIADFYDNDVDTKLTILTSAIEPALMVIMGLLIGFIVLALYLPIFQLAGTIG